MQCFKAHHYPPPLNQTSETDLRTHNLVLFARALVRRMQDNAPGFQSPKYSGPWVNATHPGGVATDQPAQAIDAYGTVAKVGVDVIKPFLKDPVDEGCRPALFAATSEDVVTEGLQGRYVSLSSFVCVYVCVCVCDALVRELSIN